MKIAFVVHQYPPRYSTGTEIYAHRLATILRAQGFDLRVFTHEPDPHRQTTYRLLEDTVDDVPVTRLTFFDALAPNHVLNDYYSVFLGKVFGSWLDEYKPDVVHVFHLMGLGLSLIEECRMRGIPVYVQLMDYWFLCPTVQLLRNDGALCEGPETSACVECLAPDNYGYQGMRMFSKRFGFVESALPNPSFVDLNHEGAGPRRAALHGRKKFIRGLLDKATALIAPSKFIKSMFLSNGYADEHMLHCPYGVDPLQGEISKIPVAGEGTVTFGFFGSVNPKKGLEILVSAFRECRGSRLRLVVRGNMTHFPKYAKRVRAFADVDPRINFRGPYGHGELAEALSSIDVLVVPSVWYENTPFVVLEAFCAGRPVIASDLGGLSEIVNDGVNGRTFRAGDPGSLTGVLAEFEEDPSLLARLAAGISNVRTLEENAADFVGLWERALAGEKMVT
ncbi:MAG: glycosyltransferase family 4 protein [Planctomycetota bacterium]|nr:glycosyltransferase family 4 protein [Planctomycetota bacterium]